MRGQGVLKWQSLRTTLRTSLRTTIVAQGQDSIVFYRSPGLDQLCPDRQMSTHKARIPLYFTGRQALASSVPTNKCRPIRPGFYCILQVPQRILLLLIDTRNPCANLARLQPDTFLEPCADCPFLGNLRLPPKNGKPCAARSSVPDLKVKYSKIS